MFIDVIEIIVSKFDEKDEWWNHVYDNTSDFIMYWCFMLRLAINLAYEFADH